MNKEHNNWTNMNVNEWQSATRTLNQLEHVASWNINFKILPVTYSQIIVVVELPK